MGVIKTNKDDLFLWAAFWSGFVTILRGVRWPNDWAEAHWLITYQFGFVKRGLIGTLFSPLAHEQAELGIKVLSILLFLLFCIGLMRICFRIVEVHSAGVISVLVVLLFTTSPYFIVSAHLIGYFDHILLICTITACALVRRNQVTHAALILSITLLVHELLFFVGYPSIVFFALVKHLNESKRSGLKEELTAFFSQYGILILLPVLVFAGIFLHHSIILESGTLVNDLTGHISHFQFVRGGRSALVPEAIVHPFFDYLSTEKYKFVQRLLDPLYLRRVAIPLALLMAYFCTQTRGLRYRPLLCSVFIAIVLLPLSLHSIAWDTSRIWCYPIVVSVLGIWGMAEINGPVTLDQRTKLFFGICCTVLIGLQFFTRIPLMDAEYRRFSNMTLLLFQLPTIALLLAWLSSLNKERQVQ